MTGGPAGSPVRPPPTSTVSSPGEEGGVVIWRGWGGRGKRVGHGPVVMGRRGGRGTEG